MIGWIFALRPRNINQDGIDHINFQLITNRSFKMTVFFVPKPKKHNAPQKAMKDFYAQQLYLESLGHEAIRDVTQEC